MLKLGEREIFGRFDPDHAPRLGELLPLGIDMAHACLFDPGDASPHSAGGRLTFATYPSLAGRVVFVSGGATGIGADIVRAFAAQSRARRLSSTCRREAGEQLASELAGTGERALLPPMRRDRHSGASGGDRARRSRALGPIAVLVNNAANDERHAIDEVTRRLLGSGAERQPAPSFLRRAGRPSADARARLRLDHQSFLDRMAARRRRKCRPMPRPRPA